MAIHVYQMVYMYCYTSKNENFEEKNIFEIPQPIGKIQYQL